MTREPNKPMVRLHLTNVAGAGATQLLLSLLPALERDSGVVISRIELPDRGLLSTYRSEHVNTVIAVYRRRVSNALSRVLECVLLSGKFDGVTPLLVLGDLPLRCKCPQIVFVQTPNLIVPKGGKLRLSSFRYLVARAIFRFNLKRVQAFIVQTNVMKAELERSYPFVVGRVHVIAQPVPDWLLKSGLRRVGRIVDKSVDALHLIYPAAGYPHKNHALLSSIDRQQVWPVKSLDLTLDLAAHPASYLDWVRCKGFLSAAQMIESYASVDAVLFLSKEESYGFPLIEAMFVGLPIVCPDLPYARILCGDQAIYFDPDSAESLRAALLELMHRITQGWWPNWHAQLMIIPKDWETVARQMLSVTVHDATFAVSVNK
ncbi:MAG: glycosyltransferase [Rhodoferax sp.]|uniref:glycosyltransferase n=1 Tax=Rhodoferax sp. TaxID=50421 RepID=UPI002ACD56DE|nr:glycosyltransferase [Rhodoferax sp.]MDZ7891013.1 glycosyltransferase [Rhodoferax sp.]